MEPQMDRLTVAKHCQHARLIKEDDEEIWISSEDLRTEGSSDEATLDKSTSNSKKIKKQKKGCTKPSRNLKQKNVTCLPELDINTVNLTPSSSHVESFENDWPKFKIDADEPSTSSSISFEINDLKRKESLKTSSDLDSEALNLESQWRPKRGSLKLPVLLTEGQTTANFAYEITSFYDNMKYKLSSLKVPVSNYRGTGEIHEENLLENWKCSPKIQDQLNFIKKLDDDISETLSLYQAERVDRIKIQNDLCKQVASERDAQKFVQLCDFSTNANSEELCVDHAKETSSKLKSVAKTAEKKFVQRNIVLARDGNMACSLTDEEKQKLDDLLKDIEEECNYQLEECSSDTDNLLELEQDSHSNGFALTEADVKRLEEMNLKLASLEEQKEVTQKSVTTHDSFWQKFLPNEALKDINAKLESLRKERLEEDGLLSQESEDEQQ